MNIYYNNCKFYNEYDNLLDDFSRNVEEGSRILINKYIKPDMKVLELGARYGTVSVCLDFLLKDPQKQLLCVDPDSTIKNCLDKNKYINNCSFNIFNGAISKQNLYVCYNGCGWETKTYITPPLNLKTEKINTLSIEQIEEVYNIKFNCLIADCEGFLLEFIKENENFFDNLICVIYEEDCCKKYPINNNYIDYNEVENFLINKDFKLVETYIDNIGLKNIVWVK
jgi:FkbM family methyltransferase